MPARANRKQKAKTAAPADSLLAWYDVHRRTLPWRARPGEAADPYRVWLSEIMLQQTTVQAVGAYYAKFLRAWPTVDALAAAPLDDVLTAWAGLGYYARARNLHAAAKVVAGEMGGQFPQTADALRALPGVGEYTAGAIAAIAFDEPKLAMDANAERVLARYFAFTEPLAKAKAKLRVLGQGLVPQQRAGDFAQALMDLGAGVCTPNRPACMSCPWFEACEARRLGIQEQLPVKAEKPLRPLKRVAAFVARDAGAVFLVKRPENGLLGGMMQPPLGPWTDEFPSHDEALAQAPFSAAWKKSIGIVRHGFTHFELEIEVYVAEVESNHPLPLWEGAHGSRSEACGGGGGADPPLPRFAPSPGRGRKSPPPTRGGGGRDLAAHDSASQGRWVRDLSTVALPTVMRKILTHALEGEGPLFAQARSARSR